MALISSIRPNLSKHWRFLAFWLRLCVGSVLLFLVCHDTAFMFSTRHVTSLASWAYIMPRIKNAKKKMVEVLNASISWFFLQRHKKHENWLKIVSLTPMYHAIACLTVTKLSYLGEHSEVSQARSLHVCWTRMLYNDRLETIDNSQSTNSAKTLKNLQCLLKFIYLFIYLFIDSYNVKGREQ